MKSLRVNHLVSSLLVMVLALLALPAQAGNYSRLVVFGDSLSDPGNAYVLTGSQSHKPYDSIPSAPYSVGGHHFSNGSTWIEGLGASMGAGNSVGPAFQTPTFTNYAVGGARARPYGAMDLTTQVGYYLMTKGGADPDALYVIFIGGNDIRDAIVPYIYVPGYDGSLTDGIFDPAAQAIVDNIGLLRYFGARNFLVVNGPNLGVVPAIAGYGPMAQFIGMSLSGDFNGRLDDALSVFDADPGINLVRFNMFNYLNGVVSAPAAYGFSDAQTPCITPDVIAGAVCSDAKDHLFWDGIHPTAAGHKQIAKAIGAALAD